MQSPKYFSLSQRFIGNYFSYIHQGLVDVEEEPFLQFFRSTYHDKPVEGSVFVRYARKVFIEGESDWKFWLMRGFEDGRHFCENNHDELGDLWTEVGETGLEINGRIFDKYLGTTNHDHAPEHELFNSTLTWCRNNYSDLFQIKSVSSQWELTRLIYDFTFWMGLWGEKKRMEGKLNSGLEF